MRVRWTLLPLNKASSPRRPRLSVENLEDRLTPSWSSIPPSVISPPLNATSVILDSQGHAHANATIATTEIDWYKFVPSVTGSYSLKALTPASGLDTVAAVYSSTGGRIAYNDDLSSTDRDSAFTASLAAGRVYYFGITNYVNTAGGSYTWSIDAPGSSTPPPPPSGDDQYEQNDTLATAFNLGTPTTTQSLSNLVMADGHDWFRFTTSAAGTTSSGVSINFQNTQGDLDLELYNSAGTRLRTSATTGNTESVNLSGLGTGTFYVHVVGFQGATNPSYLMTVTPPSGGGGSPPPPPPPPSGSYDITLIMTGLTATQQAIFEQAAQRWESIITGSLPAATYNGLTTTGVIINASARAIDGRGGILGQAGPDRFRSGSLLPYHGSMQFDSADLSALQTSGGLVYTVMHEMGHILGIGTLWTSKGLLSGASTTNPTFRGAQATAQYNAIFHTSATGVPVENTGGAGTRNAHWRESTFRNELMTGYLNSGTNPLSRITVASLADLGYSVDISRADPFAPPGGGGSLRGPGSGGGGAALRALPGNLSSDLLRQIANEVVKNTKGGSVLNAVPPVGGSAVKALAQQTFTAAKQAVPASTVAAKTTVPVQSIAAKSTDALFALAPLSTGVAKPLAV